MCGIFGYIGHKQNAAETVLKGLKLLEYRGYDSWGIAVKREDEIETEKHVGKIVDSEKNFKLSSHNSTLAIGHTRWATHGGVTVNNAHPHVDCTKKIAVLHNGIIENYQELKQELIHKGHTFTSETDTEVLPHLIEDFLKTDGKFATAVRDTFKQLRGMNAFVVMNSASSEIIAAKNGSPLVIGIGEGEFFLASDATGIIPYTNKLLFLKDNEMIILGKDLQLLSLPEGKKEEPVIETVNWKVEEVEKGSFDHFMMKEIHEQPRVIRNIVETYSDQISKLAEYVSQARGTFFIAAGTAYHTALAGIYLFSKIAKVHANSEIASEFNYLEDFLTPQSLIIALSQSGETIDVVEPLTRAKKKGSTLVGITNALGSTLYRMADYKVLLGAGAEKAVASTKAYSAKLSLMLLLSYAVAKKDNEIKQAMYDAADEIDRLLTPESLARMKTLAKKLSSAEHIYTLGRGVSYPTALEAALKIKEVSYIHTEGFAGGELKHGVIALIEKNTPCIVFAPNDDTYEAMISNTAEIKARGGMIIGISPKKSDIFDEWIEIKDLGNATIIPQIVPAQILAYYLAVEKGYDPDKPRNLAKAVTVK